MLVPLIDLPRQYNPVLTKLVAGTLALLRVPAGGLEFPIRDAIADYLAKELRLSDGFRIDKEVTFAPGCRADVMIRQGGQQPVIVEVKKRGPDMEALRQQIERYAGHIGGIVVAAPGLPFGSGYLARDLGDFPVRIAHLSSWRVTP